MSNSTPPGTAHTAGAADTADSADVADAAGSAGTAGLPRRLWCPHAWLAGRWRKAVLLEIGADGRWSGITPDTAAPADAHRLNGAVLPAVVNAHSHAFQRGFAGLTERRELAQDDFWSWREQMYSLALRVSAPQVRAIAAQLYAELLEGGYTQVCEFHYLHHDRDGRPYADPMTISRALAQAAADSGIGLTLLPVLYERAGFGQTRLDERQRRFRSTVGQVLAMRDAIRGWQLPNVSAGVAVHSLRAATPDSIVRLAHAVADDPAPIHIHVAEQPAEVSDCLAATGLRPITWLARHLPLDERWHLVHATHADLADIAAIAASGAGVVVCPSTEADLGDGRFDLERWGAQPVPVSIGSDSHVCRNWPQELRLLEYGQRLALGRRNVAANPEQGQPSTGEALFERVLAAGAAAAGFAPTAWGLRTGARADCIVLDAQAGGLLGVGRDALIDATVFGCDAAPFAEVWVSGRPIVTGGRHQRRSDLRAGFIDAIRALAQAPG